jgi:asparagine synthase (glutamine-hydrolysing)
VPYLDRTIVEYVQRLGATLKVRNGSRKWLHRRVSRQFLPPQILKRRKRGFAVNVVDGWLQSSLAGNLARRLLDSQSLMFQFLKPAAVRSLLHEHQARRHDNHKLLFSLALFEDWLRSECRR